MGESNLRGLLRTAVLSCAAIGLLALAWNELRVRAIARATAEQASAAEAMLLAEGLRFNVVQIQQFLTDVGATHEPGGYEEARADLEAARRAAAELAALRPEFAPQVLQLANDIAALHALGVSMAQAYVNDGIDAGNEIMKRPDTGFDAASAALAGKLTALRSRLVASLETARSDASTQVTWMRVSGAAAILLLLGMLGVLVRRVTTAVLPPLARLRAALEAIRDRSDTGAGEAIEDGRLDGLGPDFAPVAVTLNEILGRLRSSTARTRQRAEQICRSTQQLTSRASGQAARYEESAASMEEMTSAVKANATSASEASRLVGEARASAAEGTTVVGQAIASMQEISAASERIGEIIGLIDEIAFQTNLLALNAAVEAARAGEQGRGFAVVASEVRALAGRSAEAARQIKTLIGESLRRVEQGSDLVTRSGVSLDQIAASVERVAEVVLRISDACQEQSQGIDVVNNALIEMDQLTQENVRLFTEAASTANQLIGEPRGNPRPAASPVGAAEERELRAAA